MPKKPSCSDFIVEAIRQTRPERKGMKPGTSVSKGLRFVFSLARKASYGEREIRQSIQVLIRNKIVLLAADVSEIKRVDGEPSRWTPRGIQSISKIPSNALLGKGGWSLNAKGKVVVDERREKDYTHFFHPRLYVIADGLPASVAKSVTGIGTTKAEQIMASLQKRKKK